MNGEEIPAARIDALARARGWDRDRALHVLIDSTLVIREAARTGATCAAPEEPDVCARELLERLYTRDAVCRALSPELLDQAWQQAFRKEWAVEAYAGHRAALVASEAIHEDRGGAAPPMASEAIHEDRGGAAPPMASEANGEDRDVALPRTAEIEGLRGTFQEIRDAWARGEDIEARVNALAARHPGVVYSDFGITLWPEAGLDDQPQLPSWDPRMLQEITTLPVGEVSRVVESRSGLHVFRLESYKPAVMKDDPEVQEKLRDAVCRDRLTEIRDRYVQDLRRTAAIEIHGNGGGP